MKALALLTLAAAFALPASAQRTAPADDTFEAQKAKMQAEIQEMKKRLKDAPPPEARNPAAPAEAPAGPSALSSPGEGLPLLYMRLAKGLDGFSVKDLSKNLDWTSKNLGELVDFIHPWKKDAKLPTPEQSALAHKKLASEVAAAEELFADADALLAKGIPRDPPPPPGGLRPLGHLGYLSRPSYAYANPTADQILELKASLEANVAGHLSALLQLKTVNPPEAENETNTEKWLADARKELKAHSR